MQRYVLLFLLFFSSLVFADQAASQRLQHLLDQFHTLSADFVQRTEDGSGALLAQSKGKVLLKRPGQFRWEIVSPMQQWIITNGNTLWIYDLDLKQATQQFLQNEALNPADLLSRQSIMVLRQFSVTWLPNKKSEHFVLHPKKSNPAFQSVILSFHSNQLKTVLIESSLAQKNRFDFSRLQYNIPVAADNFVFHPPEGVSVLRASSI